MHTHGFTNMRKYMTFSQLLNSAQIRLIFQSYTPLTVPFTNILSIIRSDECLHLFMFISVTPPHWHMLQHVNIW